MPTENKLVVRDHASLERWRYQLRSTLRPSRLPVAQIRLPQLSWHENDKLSARADRLLAACGCTIGRWFLGVTLLSLLLSYAGEGEVGDISLQEASSLLGTAALAALCGKTLGLIWARVQLLALATRLHQRLVQAAPR